MATTRQKTMISDSSRAAENRCLLEEAFWTEFLTQRDLAVRMALRRSVDLIEMLERENRQRFLAQRSLSAMLDKVG